MGEKEHNNSLCFLNSEYVSSGIGRHLQGENFRPLL